MWKIVAILLLTATVILLARLVYHAPVVQTRVGLSGIELMVEAETPQIQPFMYAGIRGQCMLRPADQRRHGGEDGIDIAAGLQPEDGAAVVEQVELDIAAAPDQLLLADTRTD